MAPTADTSAQAAAVDFARRIVPFWQAALGSELLGAYLIGSLAHGGFSRRYSDVDMALVTEAGVSAQTLDRVRSEAAALSADWGPKLSVFWTDRQFCLGRFPLLDRIDYIDHAVALVERERVRGPKRTLIRSRTNRDFMSTRPGLGSILLSYMPTGGGKVIRRAMSQAIFRRLFPATIHLLGEYSFLDRYRLSLFQDPCM